MWVSLALSVGRRRAMQMLHGNHDFYMLCIQGDSRMIIEGESSRNSCHDFICAEFVSTQVLPGRG
jgi:hypothetical protein